MSTIDTTTQIAYAPKRMGQRITKKSRNEFAGCLKAWRDREGLSQSQAAAKLGINLRSLQNWEIARTRPRGFAYSVLLAKIKGR